MRIFWLSLLLLLCAPLASATHNSALLYVTGDSTSLELTPQQPTAEEGNQTLLLPNVPVTATYGVSNGGPLVGPLFVGLWFNEGVSVEGSLQVLVSSQDQSGALQVLGSSVVSLASLDPAGVDPLQLVPPDTSNPETAALYLAGQANNAVLQPPLLVDMGLIDQVLLSDTNLILELTLVPGTVATPVFVAHGASTQPAFVFLPFHEPPQATFPPPPQITPPPADEAPSSNTESTPPDTSTPPPSSAPEQESPSLSIVMILGLCLLLGSLLRRRM